MVNILLLSLFLFLFLVPFNLLLIFATQKILSSQCFAFSKALMPVTSHSLKVPYLWLLKPLVSRIILNKDEIRDGGGLSYFISSRDKCSELAGTRGLNHGHQSYLFLCFCLSTSQLYLIYGWIGLLASFSLLYTYSPTGTVKWPQAAPAGAF